MPFARPEAVFRYVNLLVANARIDEALLVATTARKLEPDNRQLESLVDQLNRQKQPQEK